MAAARPAAVAVVLVLVLVLEGVMEGGWRASVAPWDVTAMAAWSCPRQAGGLCTGHARAGRGAGVLQARRMMNKSNQLCPCMEPMLRSGAADDYRQ